MKIEKHELKGRYKKLYYCISAILFENDLQGINFGTNDDEYEPEVGTILPRLTETETIEDIQRVVYEEFGHWFGEPGDLEDYAVVAKEIWAAWHSFNNGMS